MLLKTIALIVFILVSALLLSKLFVRIIWFLFPYSALSLKLRLIIVSQILAKHLKLKEAPQYYRNAFGRDCVRIEHSEYGGMNSDDIGYVTEELFNLIASRFADYFGYTRGVVFVEDDASIFQFWSTDL